MNNNYDDLNIYPTWYSIYLERPYRFEKATFPYNEILLVTVISFHGTVEFILQIEDISTGTPKPIISKTGSFWKEIETTSKNISFFITLDETEMLIVKNGKIYHYALIQDADQQSTGTVNNG